MTGRSRFLTGGNPAASQTTTSSNSPPGPTINNVDSDFVVIIAALMCALICVLGLIAVSRCTWIHRLSAAAAARKNVANKGLKKKVLKSLPKVVFDVDQLAAKLTECPICLSEFAAGEEVRVLPQCGHGFHVGCIDTWLASHSSCPSCRQILVAVRCHKCGSVPAAAAEVQPHPRENYVDRFLP